MDQCLSSRVCEEGPDLCNIVKVVKRGFDNLVDMRLKGEGGIKDSGQGCLLGGMGDSGAINGESGVIDLAEGGLELMRKS